MGKCENFTHPNAGKELIETVRALRDANISRDQDSEIDEEVIGGIKTKLHNSDTELEGKGIEENSNEYIDGLEQAFKELRDDEAAGRVHYV